jgi:hypothetical protein
MNDMDIEFVQLIDRVLEQIVEDVSKWRLDSH